MRQRSVTALNALPSTRLCPLFWLLVCRLLRLSLCSLPDLRCVEQRERERGRERERDPIHPVVMWSFVCFVLCLCVLCGWLILVCAYLFVLSADMFFVA
jgi:hypothetical protein